MGESQGSESSSATTPADDGASSPTTLPAGDTSSSDGGGDVSSGDPSASDSSGSAGGSSSGGDAESTGSETGTEVVFDEEFLWVADFLRTNCVTCHSTGVNGALLLPDPAITNEEIRLALDGVVANTGLLLVEPSDRQASQTYLQITNEFGAIFPVEDTDRFGAWIDAGALYYAP